MSFSQRVGGDFFDDVSANRSSQIEFRRGTRCWPMKEELITSLDSCSAFSDCFRCCKKEFNSFFDTKQANIVGFERIQLSLNLQGFTISLDLLFSARVFENDKPLENQRFLRHAGKSPAGSAE